MLVPALFDRSGRSLRLQFHLTSPRQSAQLWVWR
jgi:hypothetical protein